MRARARVRVLVFAVTIPIAAVGGENLLEDPSFEAAKERDRPAARAAGAAKALVQVVATEVVDEEARHSARTTFLVPSSTVTVLLCSGLPGRRYSIVTSPG